MKTREEIIDDAKRQRDEIDQYLRDVEHWNNSKTRFEQVEADPDGEMSKMRNDLSRFIAVNSAGV